MLMALRLSALHPPQVPAVWRNMPLLCCLVEHGAELDWYGLKYVLQYGHMLPVAHAPLQDFLTNYVRTRRNPANTCYAIALCFSMVAKEHTSKVGQPALLAPAAPPSVPPAQAATRQLRTL